MIPSFINQVFHLLETLFFSYMKHCPWMHILEKIRLLCHILLCQLRGIGKISSFLSTDIANKLAVFLILSMLDYCNSFLAGIPDNQLNKLQRIQNHAARLVLRKSRHASSTTLLRILHWLPVKARGFDTKLLLCFQCIYQNSMPPCISELLHPYCPSRTLRSLDISLADSSSLLS